MEYLKISATGIETKSLPENSESSSSYGYALQQILNIQLKKKNVEFPRF